MIITKKALHRRTFLRGMGASLTLPFLDAMIPALSAAAASPMRLGVVYRGNGAELSRWTPQGEGRIKELSPTLSALMPFLDQITVISNLELKNAEAVVNGNHATSNAAFLSAARAKHTEGSDYQSGTTIDQIAATYIGKETPVPSLELGTEILSNVGTCDNGYACVYQNSLSWSSPTTPLPAEADPRVVFERLFGDGGSTADRRSELRKQASILDSMKEDMARLQRKLGQNDRTKVDHYLDSVREVERRMQTAEKHSAASSLPALERPISVPALWEDHVKLMFDLQVLALQSDITRVITYQLCREVSGRTYPQIGVPGGHHAISHHRNNPEELAKLGKIDAYHMSLFAYFLQKLSSTPDGDGSLLDHSIYLLGGGMGNSDAHTHFDLPILIAGGGAGKGGRHIKYAKRTPMANLLLTLLDKVGVHLESFVDSTGKLDEIL